MAMLPRLRLLVGLLLILAMAPVQGAFAHAQLLSTVPSDDALLDTSPPMIELNFNEPVNPLAVRLVQPDGSGVDLTAQSVGGATTTVTMPAEMNDGTHVLSWRVVSTDGHPIAGSLVFSIGQISGAANVDVEGDQAVSVALWLSKAVLFIAMFIGIGGAAFSALAPLPGASRGLSLALSLVGIVIAPVTLGLQGLDALGLPLRGIFDANAWSTGLSTSYGATTIAAIVAFAWALGSLKLPKGRVASGLGIAAAGLAALSMALSGHASAASPQWVTRPAIFLHTAGVLFWVGALFPLWILLRDPTEPANRALAGFSKGIPFAVAPLVVSGLALAAIQLGAPGPQWATPYGFILAGKMVLLALLFSLALWNRRWLTEPALAGERVAQKRLRRSIGWEMVLVLLILALVAGWRFTPPPRALADVPPPVAAEPIMEHLIDGNTMAMLTVTPGSVGPVTIDIMVSDIEGTPKDALGVTVIISSPDLGVEPIHRDATEIEGIWRVENLLIPVSGTWQLEAEIRISRFELARPRGEIVIP